MRRPTPLHSLIVPTLASMLVSMLAFAGCKTNPSTGRSQFIIVSPESTAQMGIEAKPQMIAEYGGEVKSKELREYVNTVGRRLSKHVEKEFADVPWEFITLDSDVINAFALPAGKVFMSRGLLEQLDNEAALAGVLGHEIGHVTGRHIDERISQSTVVQGAAGVGGAVVGGQGAWAEIIPLVIGGAGQGYLLKFNRDQESEADRQGLKYMTRAYYDPMGMADVMKVLIAASEGNDQWEMLATHPNPERRLAEVMELIKTEYAFTQGNPEFKKFKNRFDRDARPFLQSTSADAGLGELGPPSFWCSHCREQSDRLAAIVATQPTTLVGAR